ncbi:acyl-CoA dehydrogenase family protein [Bhargavaea beijingensis]|uniref:acyl-CoA dehydrogenase family protein n=1 Tax=Bhargavaea beijingensis TaxID=426756 RepID=UPI0022243207|nr:acyl-CoA dehydrogenase family protein [Bhargavaea beijingensis]MCW1927344.1 acyl-CoA dehydrogenase family protein [Bhargavaea beijingensis]
MKELQLPLVRLTPEQEAFRHEVRSFLDEERKKGTFATHADSWLSGYSAEFSKMLGKRGWIGMTWPKEYGGSERSAIDRYILTEELLAAGAPVASHWFADRQSGPLLLNLGTEEQKDFFLPKITKGECFFSIGLSEPNSGSDLASLKTRAEKVEGGWVVNGMKTWTSGAHHSHYMITLCRTSPQDEKRRHDGMSQLIIDLSAEGVSIRPIQFLTGEHHFNEVFLENVFVPDNRVIGEVGNGWKQGMLELAYERSGPERILSTFPLLQEAQRLLTEQQDQKGLAEVAKLNARLWSLRNMSIGVAQMLEEGKDVALAASLVKDLGTLFEQSVAEAVRLLLPMRPSVTAERLLDRLMAESVLHGPGFTIRGGTTEILRGIVAKGVASA